jgi:retron-type reverse transcriptase
VREIGLQCPDSDLPDLLVAVDVSCDKSQIRKKMMMKTRAAGKKMKTMVRTKVMMATRSDNLTSKPPRMSKRVEMRKAIAERLQTCGLELHPEKTKVVYCKDDFRKKKYPNEKFDFLG